MIKAKAKPKDNKQVCALMRRSAKYVVAFLEFPAQGEDQSPTRRRCTIGPTTPLHHILRDDNFVPDRVQAALCAATAPGAEAILSEVQNLEQDGVFTIDADHRVVAYAPDV